MKPSFLYGNLTYCIVMPSVAALVHYCGLFLAAEEMLSTRPVAFSIAFYLSLQFLVEAMRVYFQDLFLRNCFGNFKGYCLC